MNRTGKVLIITISMMVSALFAGCIDFDYDLNNIQSGSENVSLGNKIAIPISTFKVNLSELIDFSVITEQPQKVSVRGRVTDSSVPAYKIPDFSTIDFDISSEDLDDLNSYAFIEDMKKSQTTTLLCWMSGLTLDLDFTIILSGEKNSINWVKTYDASVDIVSSKLALFKCQLSSEDVTDILEGLNNVQFVFDFTDTKDDNTFLRCSADDLISIGLSFSKGEVVLSEAVKQLAVLRLVPTANIVSGEFLFRNSSDIFCGKISEYATLTDKSTYTTVILTEDSYEGFVLDSHVKNAEFVDSNYLYKENLASCSSLERVSAMKMNNLSLDAFDGKTTLNSVSLPSATSVGNNAFNGCTSLTTIALPKIQTVGTTIFKGCTSLSSVVWPVSMTFDSNTLFDTTNVWTSAQNDTSTTVWTKQ